MFGVMNMKKIKAINGMLFKYIKKINGERFEVLMHVYNTFIDVKLAKITYNLRPYTVFVSKPGIKAINRKNKFDDIFSCAHADRRYEKEFRLLYECFLDHFELTFGL